MRAAWRARFPQIMAGLLLGTVGVGIWTGWQVFLTALIAVLIIGTLFAPRRHTGECPLPPGQCKQCVTTEAPHKVWVDDRTYEIHPGGKDSPERIAALDAHLRRMRGGEN